MIARRSTLRSTLTSACVLILGFALLPAVTACAGDTASATAADEVPGGASGDVSGDATAAGTDSVPGDAVAEPTDYRIDDYDAPVPAGLAGATTVAAAEVQRLLDKERAVVVDVIPAHRRPDVIPEGQLWLPVPHTGVAGALWLPDTGFGALAEVTENYLFDHLAEATGGDRDRALVFYCRIDCWMSWNAAKRALRHGYTDVHWYRDGIEDWMFEGFETATLQPAPGARLPGD